MGIFDMYDAEKAITGPGSYGEKTQFTPYANSLGGLLARKFESMFMPDEMIKAQNADYFRARYAPEAQGILNNPAVPGSMQYQEAAPMAGVRQNAGGLLNVTPEALALMARNPDGSLTGVNQSQQPGQYSPQQMAQLSQLPGYAQYAQSLGNQQAQRQGVLQGQAWDTNPTSPQGQQTALQLRNEEAARAQQIVANKNAQAQLGISGGHLGLAREQFEFQKAQAAAPAKLGFTDQQKILTAQNNATNALATLRDIGDVVKNEGAYGIQAMSGKSAAMQQELEANLLPIVTSMFKPTGDAPSETELSQIKAYIGDITARGTSETKAKKLQMLEQHVMQQYAPYQRYGQLTAPLPGSSPFGKQYGARPLPPLTPVGR